MFFCDRCEDTGSVMHKSGTIVACKCCRESRAFKNLLQATADELYDKKRYIEYNDLYAVLVLLPEFSVMAVLEAYARRIDNKIIVELMRVFKVKRIT